LVAAPLSVEEELWDRMDGAWSPWVLLAAVVVPYAVLCGVDIQQWIWGPAPRELMSAGALSTRQIDQGQFWRLPRSLFLHADLLHLVFNGAALIVLGRLGEAIFGKARLLWIFLICGLAGAALSWSAGAVRTVGSSGALFGLLGAEVVFGWKYRALLQGMFGDLLRRRLAFWGVLNLLLGTLLPMIDNYSHFGGFLAGLVMGMICDSRLIHGGPSKKTEVAMLLGAAGVLGYGFLLN
jgi:rhomboid protease GluP